MSRSTEALVRYLRDQAAALRSSCDAFDQGREWEAPRIATAVANIVFDDGKRSKSVLTQLGAKHTLRYTSSISIRYPKGERALGLLIGVEMDGTGPRFFPNCVMGIDTPRFDLSFANWWKETIYQNGSAKLSRENLTRVLRNQDGGSHFDEVVRDQTYLAMINNFDPRLTFTFNGERVELQNGHLVTMRQIGWELIESLRPILED